MCVEKNYNRIAQLISCCCNRWISQGDEITNTGNAHRINCNKVKQWTPTHETACCNKCSWAALCSCCTQARITVSRQQINTEYRTKLNGYNVCSKFHPLSAAEEKLRRRFLWAICTSCHLTNSVKAQKSFQRNYLDQRINHYTSPFLGLSLDSGKERCSFYAGSPIPV